MSTPRDEAPADHIDPAQQTLLVSGLQALQVEYSGAQLAQLLNFVSLLRKWNRVYNLTAVRGPREMVLRHLLDSIAVAPFLRGKRVLDVGTGAGLPGIPLAIVCPGSQFTLLDSNSKKTRFVQQAVAELGLTNVNVVQARVEDYRTDTPYDVVVSRAFASIADMLGAAGHLCAPDGVILAMKGVNIDNELNHVPQGYTVEGVHQLHIPGLDEGRLLVCLHPVTGGVGGE